MHIHHVINGEKRLKFFQCPNCKEQVTRIWGIFFFPSSFHISKLCRICKEPIQFNPLTIKALIFWLISGIVICNIVFRLFPINSTFFETIFLLFFVFIPVFTGKKLFIIDERRKKKGKQSHDKIINGDRGRDRGH